MNFSITLPSLTVWPMTVPSERRDLEKVVKAYKLIRQGSALRLLLSGDWVAHPSGFHFVDINRPFMAGTLDALEEQILGILRAHHVKQDKK